VTLALSGVNIEKKAAELKLGGPLVPTVLGVEAGASNG
jgi:hypothetical protein